MFLKKRKIKREIEEYKEQIKELEKKLSRSQSSCLNAMLSNAQPSEEDIYYHTFYLQQIEELRNKIRTLNQELEGK